MTPADATFLTALVLSLAAVVPVGAALSTSPRLSFALHALTALLASLAVLAWVAAPWVAVIWS